MAAVKTQIIRTRVAYGILVSCPKRPAIRGIRLAASRRSWPSTSCQPPGHGRERPVDAGPFVWRGRRGADRAPAPRIDPGQQTPPPAPTVGQTRPWIGIAMWCATGALAIVAAVLIFTGKQESTSTVEEAPQWQTGPVVSDSANPSGDGANGRWGSGQPVDGTALWTVRPLVRQRVVLRRPKRDRSLVPSMCRPTGEGRGRAEWCRSGKHVSRRCFTPPVCAWHRSWGGWRTGPDDRSRRTASRRSRGVER